MHPKRRAVLGILCTLFLMVLLACVLVWRAFRQDQLNSQLITAIKQENTRSALTLLDQGADANAVESEQVPDLATIWVRLITRWRRPRDTQDSPSIKHALAFLLDAVEEKGIDDDLDHLGAALVMHGADTHFRVSDKCPNILWYAAIKNMHHTFRALLAKGANVNGEDDAPPLFVADKEILLLLLQHGADPNKKDTHGRTALMFQADSLHHSYYRSDQVRILLEHGAQVTPKAEDGYTLLDSVRERLNDPSNYANQDEKIEDQKIADLLRKYGAK